MTQHRQFPARLRAWNALPPGDRAIFASVRIDALDYDEAARRHGCTVQDVEQVIVRVLIALMDADDDAVSCPLLSGPSTMTVWIKEGTTNAFEEAQARGDHRQAA